MRIAFHVPRASHLKPGFSGDKILVRGLVEELGRREHDVHVVSHLNIRDLWRGRVERKELLHEIRRVRAEMERFAPDAWLVYGASTTNPDLFGWRIANASRPRRAKYLLLATDLGSGKRLPARWRRLFAWTHRRSLAHAGWLSAYHPSSYDELVRHARADQRLALLPPAVRGWHESPSMEQARRRLGVSVDRSVLFCASRFPEPDDRSSGKHEMLLNLIAASRALPSNAHLLIAGDGPGRAALAQAAASVQSTATVQFVGAVNHDEMPWYHAASDFFAYPNLVDRPWLAVLEAQACERPVVTMRTRSAELTVRDGGTGLLASNLSEFQEAVAALAADRLQCHKMGAAAGQYVAENHSLSARIDQIEQALNDQEPRSLVRHCDGSFGCMPSEAAFSGSTTDRESLR